MKMKLEEKSIIRILKGLKIELDISNKDNKIEKIYLMILIHFFLKNKQKKLDPLQKVKIYFI